MVSRSHRKLKNFVMLRMESVSLEFFLKTEIRWPFYEGYSKDRFCCLGRSGVGLQDS